MSKKLHVTLILLTFLHCLLRYSSASLHGIHSIHTNTHSNNDKNSKDSHDIYLKKDIDTLMWLQLHGGHRESKRKKVNIQVGSSDDKCDNDHDNDHDNYHDYDYDNVNNNDKRDQVAISAQAKVKGRKRKRVKAEFKKWLGAFSQEDSIGNRVLTYHGLMLAGAVARATSATFVHPLNVIKTLLQTREGKLPPMTWNALSRGAGSQFLMSIPHGALNFAVTESSKITMSQLSENHKLKDTINPSVLNPMLDFISSAVATFICSSVSTPQMVLTDRIMTGRYNNFIDAVYNVFTTEGIIGFYRGWFPALCQKIPSYALTWMFFQQIKTLFKMVNKRVGNTLENTLLGSLSAAGACCVMIPVDTVKTRMVMQSRGSDRYYEGMVDCFRKILNEEGIWTFYKALPPRLAAVMPMIGIQFSVYELMKRVLLQTDKEQSSSGPSSISSGSSTTMKMYQTITENKQGLLKKEVVDKVVERLETVEIDEE